jgi:two-component system, sporulation sensor kinase E
MRLNYKDLSYKSRNKHVITHSKKDGKLFPVSILKSGEISSGKYYVIDDITKHINFERDNKILLEKNRNITNLFNEFTNIVPQMLWVKNINLEFTYINEKAARVLFGIEDYKNILGKTESQLSRYIANNYKHGFISNSEKSDKMVLNNKDHLSFSDSGYVVGKWIDLKFDKFPMFNVSGELIGVIGMAQDITENIQAVKRKKDIYKIAKIGDWYRDLINNNVEWSDGLYDIYELDKNKTKLLNHSLDDFYINSVHPEDTEIRKQYRDDLYNKKEAYAEYRIIINGKIKYTTVKGKALTDNKNNIIAFYGIQQDITELKLTEKKLKINEQKYNRLLNHAPVGIISCNLRGDVDYVNQKLIDLFGLTKDSLYSLNTIKNKYPELNSVLNLFKSSMTKDKIMETEGFYQIGSNQKFYHFYVNPLKKDNIVYGAIGIVEDYTYKKSIELELIKEKNLIQKLIQTIPDGVYVKDSKHNYTLLNNAMLDLLKQEDLINVIGTSDKKYFKDYAEIHKKEKQILSKGSTFNLKEELLVGDKKRWVNTKKVPLRDDKDKIIGVVGISNDITDLKLTQKQLEKSKIQIDKRNKELEESNEILENFAYTTSHDLKTPLRGINSFIDKMLIRLNDLEYNIEDEKLNKYIVLIKKSVKQMNSIITDTLNYARVSKDDLILDDNNVFKCVNESIPQLPENVKIDIKVSKNLEILCDKTQLVRVFSNLISNAIKFNSKNNKEIEIGFNKSNKYIYVKDNGDGISEEYFDKIFNLFQRLHGSKIYGNGLGLAIVKRIVQRHNWTVEVESKIGKGSTFKIYI